MSNIDPCAEIVKARNALQHTIDDCHTLLDQAGIQADTDLCQRIQYVLDSTTQSSRTLDEALVKLRKLIDELDKPGI